MGDDDSNTRIVTGVVNTNRDVLHGSNIFFQSSSLSVYRHRDDFPELVSLSVHQIFFLIFFAVLALDYDYRAVSPSC